MTPSPASVILMGVSGSGKTTIGQAIAAETDYVFFDGDDFHPAQNIAKMSAGIPLTDQDRVAWVRSLIELVNSTEPSLKIIACSALTRAIRAEFRLRCDPAPAFVYLKGSYELIRDRMRARQGHYMKSEMLRSQFTTLEDPATGLVVDISQEVDSITKKIIRELGLQASMLPGSPG